MNHPWRYIIWFTIGLVAGVTFLQVARVRSADEEKRWLALGLIVAAAIYVGFGVAWGNGYWTGIEAAGVLFYTLFAWLGYRYNLIWLAIGWALHVGWDIILHLLGPGERLVPAWYAVACVSFDLFVAGFILLRKRAPT